MKKNNRFSRLINLMTILRSGKSFTLDELATQCDVSSRTIYRDMKEIADLGMPFNFNEEKQTYTVDQASAASPIDFSYHEAVSLLLLTYNAKKIACLPFKNSVMTAGYKIENQLPDETRQFCVSVLEKSSIKTAATPVQECSTAVFFSMQRAMVEKRIVSISYDSPVDCVITELSPYHLLYNDLMWYVFGYSIFHHDIVCFQLNYIKEVSLTCKQFSGGDDFDVHKHIGKAWSIEPEGTIYDIKLHFSSEIARLAASVQWHMTQRATFNEDDSAMMEFQVDGLGEISRWILSYGDQVRVIAPKVRRDNIAGVVQSAARLYEQIQDNYIQELVFDAGPS
jgi:predicted DNA-binding transcriptional regulator YafY